MQLPLTMNSFLFIGSFGDHERDNESVKLTLMPAIRRASIVCGTPSWSLPQEKMMRRHNLWTFIDIVKKIDVLTLSMPNVVKGKFRPNFIFINFEKQKAPYESTGGELSFEWSHRRISSTNAKVTVTLENSIKHSGSESPKSDQHQFSPHNLNTLSKEKVMRFNKMITSRIILWSFIKILTTNSLRKSMEISLENLYVNIGA